MQEQVQAPWATLPAVPKFWAAGPSDQVARGRLATSSRAWGKAPAVQAESLPLAKTNKGLVYLLQVEELAVEEAHLGRDAATLEVVMEAAESLKRGQLEGFRVHARHAPPKVAGPRQVSRAVAVEPFMVVAA